MNRFSLTHLSNEVLRRELATKAARENEATAGLLAHIAEFDERKLYLPEAYESMLAYCTGELKLSEDAAKKRIQVARVGRTWPAVFEALESGRVHLTGLRVLAPHITPGTVEELLAAATHKTKEAIERLLAERSPRLDVPALVAPTCAEGAPGHLRNTDSQALTGADTPPACDRVTPLSAESYAVQFTRSREADERFRYAQDLLGHQVKSSDLAEVYDRAIKLLIEKLERVRFGACAKPRKRGRPKAAEASRLEPHQLEVIPWLRELGWREAECRIAVERCRDMADAPLEERVKGALRWFGARIGRKVSYSPAP
ncbi:MAG TPA: hypothetical protein VNM39_09550 [Verrucomicrobiae bacterium]|nr:hypothetical protein [Verrucomicrobiae bacterium]